MNEKDSNANIFKLHCTVQPALRGHSKKYQKLVFKTNYHFIQDKSNAMLPREHSAKLWTFIKLPFFIKIFVLSIFEWSLKTGFTVFLILKIVFSPIKFCIQCDKMPYLQVFSINKGLKEKECIFILEIGKLYFSAL